jgi:hypothetical protein
MSASSKQPSRWGSFLQQAVAGVESRLDNMLLDGVDEQTPPKKTAAPSPAVAATKSDSSAYYLSFSWGRIGGSSNP